MMANHTPWETHKSLSREQPCFAGEMMGIPPERNATTTPHLVASPGRKCFVAMPNSLPAALKSQVPGWGEVGGKKAQEELGHTASGGPGDRGGGQWLERRRE